MNIDSYLYYPPLSSYDTTHPNYKTSPVPHLYYPCEKHVKLMVFYHGNATDAGRVPIYKELNKMGYDVMIMEYSGYGPYIGDTCTSFVAKPSSKSIIDDVNTLAKHLKGKTEVHVMGQSIGTGPACLLAKLTKTPFLHLFSPYTSISDIAGDFTGGVGYYITQNSFDNKACLESLSLEGTVVNIYHGLHDEIVSYSHALKLSDIKNVKLHSLQCGHNDIDFKTCLIGNI